MGDDEKEEDRRREAEAPRAAKAATAPAQEVSEEESESEEEEEPRLVAEASVPDPRLRPPPQEVSDCSPKPLRPERPERPEKALQAERPERPEMPERRETERPKKKEKEKKKEKKDSRSRGRSRSRRRRRRSSTSPARREVSGSRRPASPPAAPSRTAREQELRRRLLASKQTHAQGSEAEPQSKRRGRRNAGKRTFMCKRCHSWLMPTVAGFRSHRRSAHCLSYRAWARGVRPWAEAQRRGAAEHQAWSAGELQDPDSDVPEDLERAMEEAAAAASSAPAKAAAPAVQQLALRGQGLQTARKELRSWQTKQADKAQRLQLRSRRRGASSGDSSRSGRRRSVESRRKRSRESSRKRRRERKARKSSSPVVDRDRSQDKDGRGGGGGSGGSGGGATGALMRVMWQDTMDRLLRG